MGFQLPPTSILPARSDYHCMHPSVLQIFENLLCFTMLHLWAMQTLQQFGYQLWDLPDLVGGGLYQWFSFVDQSARNLAREIVNMVHESIQEAEEIMAMQEKAQNNKG